MPINAFKKLDSAILAMRIVWSGVKLLSRTLVLPWQCLTECKTKNEWRSFVTFHHAGAILCVFCSIYQTFNELVFEILLKFVCNTVGEYCYCRLHFIKHLFKQWTLSRGENHFGVPWNIKENINEVNKETKL